MARKKENLARRVRGKVIDAVETTKEKFVDAKERAEDYVKDNPVKSTVMAAVIGAAVATGVTLFLLRPRKRSLRDYLRDYI